MMNGYKHRYTYSQIRLTRKGARWITSGRVGSEGEQYKILKRRRPKHPAYRRRRRRQPAFSSIIYISNRVIGFSQLAEARYSYPLHTRAERKQWRAGRRSPIREADLYRPARS